MTKTRGTTKVTLDELKSVMHEVIAKKDLTLLLKISLSRSTKQLIKKETEKQKHAFDKVAQLKQSLKRIYREEEWQRSDKRPHKVYWITITKNGRVSSVESIVVDKNYKILSDHSWGYLKDYMEFLLDRFDKTQLKSEHRPFCYKPVWENRQMVLDHDLGKIAKQYQFDWWEKAYKKTIRNKPKNRINFN